MAPRALIGVDWGSTNLRAFRFDDAGAVVDVRRSTSGASTLRGGAFEGALRSVVADWIEGNSARIVICGMAGGREGWIEAPYAPCPCDLPTLARSVIPVAAEFAEILIAPGAKSIRNDGMVEVMRSEETQILGELEAEDAPALVIAPGTHSKWARVENGRLMSFRTYMTGELFALLKQHSILGRTMAGGTPHDHEAFDLGVRRALEDEGLLNIVFSTRTEVLFERLSPAASPSYLSGLLLGAEIVEATARATAPAGAPIVLIGDPALTAHYARALTVAGRAAARSIDGEQAAARGLWRILQERAA